MFFIDEEKTIHITRGDTATFSVSGIAGYQTSISGGGSIGSEAEGGGVTGETTQTPIAYEFGKGAVVRFKVFAKKDCTDVVMQKDIEVTEKTTEVKIILDSEDTKIGEVINKPKDYWYEVETFCVANPNNSQTLIGYDEDGAKVFKLYPEGGVYNE